jgi:hypothetical protein
VLAGIGFVVRMLVFQKRIKSHCCCGRYRLRSTISSAAAAGTSFLLFRYIFSFRKLESQSTAAAAAGESVRTSAAEIPRSRKRYTFFVMIIISQNEIMSVMALIVQCFCSKNPNRSPILTGKRSQNDTHPLSKIVKL